LCHPCVWTTLHREMYIKRNLPSSKNGTWLARLTGYKVEELCRSYLLQELHR
jgi:hypothetical protein